MSIHCNTILGKDTYYGVINPLVGRKEIYANEDIANLPTLNQHLCIS